MPEHADTGVVFEKEQSLPTLVQVDPPEFVPGRGTTGTLVWPAGNGKEAESIAFDHYGGNGIGSDSVVKFSPSPNSPLALNYVQFEGRVHNRTRRGLSELGEVAQELEPYLDKNKIILDVGTGDGNFVKELRSQGYQVFGLDLYLNGNQIRENQTALKEHTPKVWFAGGLHRTGFAPESVDVVTCSVVMHYGMENSYRKIALDHLLGILKKGGVFIIYPIRGNEENFRQILDDNPSVSDFMFHNETNCLVVTKKS